MSNEVANYTIHDVEVMADAVVKSGLFGVKTREQALALMMLCQAEGLHPMKAVSEYHIIQGKPALKADAMLARFQRAGGSVRWNRLDDKEVSATFSHPQGGEATINWTMDMAKNAGLSNKDTWKQYPRQLLRARVISEGVRTVFPGIVTGIYTPEEVSDFDVKPPSRSPVETLKEKLAEPVPTVEATPPAPENPVGHQDMGNEAPKETYPEPSKYISTDEAKRLKEKMEAAFDAKQYTAAMRKSANDVLFEQFNISRLRSLTVDQLEAFEKEVEEL